MEVELVDISWLKPHEEFKQKKVDELVKVTLQWGCYTKPLLVDRKTGAILDGHHRHQVGLVLGLSKVPAVLFDYLVDDSIIVEPFPNKEIDSLSKQDVIDMSLSDSLFTPKTTRHTTSWDSPPIAISLDDLR